MADSISFCVDRGATSFEIVMSSLGDAPSKFGGCGDEDKRAAGEFTVPISERRDVDVLGEGRFELLTDVYD